MESQNFSRKLTNINIVCNDVIHNNNWKSIFHKNPDWLLDNCFGEIDSNLLYDLVKLRYENKLDFCILYPFVEYATGDVISDNIFDMLLSFENKERESFLVSLSHKKLSEKQLLYLCDIGYTFECYYDLAILYYTDKKYSCDDLKVIIMRFKNGKFSYLYDDLLLELSSIEHDVVLEKKFLINHLLEIEKYKKSSGNHC